MALTVEDGTGMADADAFGSVEDADAYHTARGTTAWTDVESSPSDTKDAAIRRATAYLCNSFTWKGVKTNGRAQALAWPRDGVEDEDGEEIGPDELPIEIVHACFEIAARELATPGFTAPDVNMTERVKREKVGDIEVEYAAAQQTASAARPVMVFVEDMIAGLLATATSSLVGSAVRT